MDTTDVGLRMGAPQARWVLFTTGHGSGLASRDATVVTVALERIGSESGASFSGLQWTVERVARCAVSGPQVHPGQPAGPPACR